MPLTTDQLQNGNETAVILNSVAYYLLLPLASLVEDRSWHSVSVYYSCHDEQQSDHGTPEDI